MSTDNILNLITDVTKRTFKEIAGYILPTIILSLFLIFLFADYRPIVEFLNMQIFNELIVILIVLYLFIAWVIGQIISTLSVYSIHYPIRFLFEHVYRVSERKGRQVPEMINNFLFKYDDIFELFNINTYQDHIKYETVVSFLKLNRQDFSGFLNRAQTIYILGRNLALVFMILTILSLVTHRFPEWSLADIYGSSKLWALIFLVLAILSLILYVVRRTWCNQEIYGLTIATRVTLKEAGDRSGISDDPSLGERKEIISEKGSDSTDILEEIAFNDPHASTATALNWVLNYNGAPENAPDTSLINDGIYGKILKITTEQEYSLEYYMHIITDAPSFIQFITKPSSKSLYYIDIELISKDHSNIVNGLLSFRVGEKVISYITPKIMNIVCLRIQGRYPADGHPWTLIYRKLLRKLSVRMIGSFRVLQNLDYART